MFFDFYLAGFDPRLFTSFLLVCTSILLTIPSLFIKNKSDFQRIQGVFLVCALAFATLDGIAYILALLVVATMVTELKFLETIVAIIWRAKEYFDYIAATTKQSSGQPTSPAVEEEANRVVGNTEQNQNYSEIINRLQTERDNNLLIAHFERTYRVIFGSQINILEVAESIGSVIESRALAIYNSTVWAGGIYSFEKFMEFLTSISKLLEFNASEKTYTITPLGRLFLQYLRANGLPFSKPN